MKKGFSAVLLCASFMMSSLAHSAILNYTATINGSQADAGAGSGSSATGTGVFTLDTNTMNFNWIINYSDFVSLETGAHIHGPAQPFEDAGVVIPLELGLLKQGSEFLTISEAENLNDGLLYVNIHSRVFPGGEIRGQIVSAVPLPAAAWLMSAGLIALLGFKRRLH